MSAVKNLRAMFEQKSETPPDRGRSPVPPHGPGSDSPRPLSKVRTSFVAVEKGGRIGLQREGSQDSISVFRKNSGDSNVTTPTAATEKSNPFEIQTKSPAKSSLQNQPIIESPSATSGSKISSDLSRDVVDVNAQPASGANAVPNVPTSNGAAQHHGSPSTAPAPPHEVKANEAGSGNGSHKTTGKGVTGKPAVRTTKPAPKPLSAPATTKPAAKLERPPASQRGPKTPTAPSASQSIAKITPEKKAQPPEKPATPRATPGPKPAGPSSVERQSAVPASPSTAGFVKPRPKSPTRPIKLPPSLTTHTASSGSKVNVPRQSLSRASGTTPPSDPHGRPASRASASTAASAPHKPAPTRGLRRQSSTINRPRPSLGPPPKQPAKDHPPTRREKEVDQGFLARMMRPTQSSASKATEKILTSPPRKAATAPRKANPAKPLKKAPSQIMGAAQSTVHPEASTAKQVAGDDGRAKSAVQATEAATAAEDVVSLPTHDRQQDTSIQVEVSISEQSEAAESAIATTKETGDEAVSPQADGTPAVEQLPKPSEPEPIAGGEEASVDGPGTSELAESKTMEVTSTETTGEAASEDHGNAPEAAAA